MSAPVLPFTVLKGGKREPDVADDRSADDYAKKLRRLQKSLPVGAKTIEALIERMMPELEQRERQEP